MAKRRKTGGGSRKGRPNKATDETRALIEEKLGESPLAAMAILCRELLDGKRVLMVPVTRRENGETITETEESDAKAIEVATKLLSELAQYHSPKRKAVELSGPDGAPIPVAALRVEVVEARA